MSLVLVRSRCRATILGLVATTLGVAGCSWDAIPTVPPFSDPATQTYDVRTGVVISNMTRVSSHLYTQDIVDGTGRTVTTGDNVSVFYVGKLISGFQFDGRVAPSAPFDFVVDSTARNVLRGWIGGLPGAKVGGTRRLVIGPALGYQNRTVLGDDNNLTIPQNSVLVFDVQIISATPPRFPLPGS